MTATVDGASHPGRRFRLHGLTVATPDFGLDAREADQSDPVDVEVHVGPDGPVPAVGEVPPGRVLGYVRHPDDSELTVVAVPGHGPTDAAAVEMHYHGYASALISIDRRTIELRFAAEHMHGLASVLVGGGIVAVLSTLLGRPVLHASAVTTTTEQGPRVVAVVGSSGMGKSTVATLAVRDGAGLLADDVLRLDVIGDDVLAWPGATATRLRDNARSLADATPDRATATADGRTSLTMRLSPGVPTATAAIVIPVPDREATEVSAERLTGIEAFFGLAAFPRLAGWQDPETSAANHVWLGAVASRVPILRVRVPWGPPFPDGVGAQILQAALAGAGVS